MELQLVTTGPPEVTVMAKVADADDPLGVTVSVNVPAAVEAGIAAVMEVSDQAVTVAAAVPIVTDPIAVPKFVPDMVKLFPA